ncbi:hypothetical protein UNDYM_1641 [Undibacterium sp. YM2]|uniref:hypothetical protein n=1 Tax=Undibacterium sp. YM2 TaxID=2058625 RepID=UPI001331D2CC|nr:hypothetical protein [Undibacterium sp. YM2]BBB65894.1 hypothetical protein UNDYM_1641 [Undibacterium sp. YM2]
MKRLKTDSDAFAMLARLVELGGVAQFSQFRDVSVKQLSYRVGVLRDHFLIVVEDKTIRVTQAGKNYVAEHHEMVSAIVTQVAVEKVAEVQLNRPYASIRSTTNARPYRPGSEDYKQIPSLNFGVRTPRPGDIVE